MKPDLQHIYIMEQPRFLDELKEWLAIPSISVGDSHRNYVHAAAEWLAEKLRQAGMEHVEILQTAGLPVVYGDWLHAPDKPTALIYGHYDVQPADSLELWITPPFEPNIRDEKLFARGATDDKGQLFIHIKTVETLLRTEGKLPVNIKFCIEGEEEIASPNLPAFLEKETERLKADVVVISDSPMQAKGVPSIQYGLRGLCAVQIDVQGPAHDLHSGMFGGGVANPLHALSELLAGLHDRNGRVTVEGFYDDVPDISEVEREAFRSTMRERYSGSCWFKSCLGRKAIRFWKGRLPVLLWRCIRLLEDIKVMVLSQSFRRRQLPSFHVDSSAASLPIK